MRAISPDFTDYFVGFAWGEIYSRTGLDPKTKELISIAILSATGLSHEYLKIHVLMALEVGCSKEEIIETIIHTTVHSGFISGMMAMKTVKEAFDTNEKLPEPGPSRILRLDARALHAALDAERLKRRMKWKQVADELPGFT